MLNYKEIYLEVEKHELQKRNKKQLYNINLRSARSKVGLKKYFQAPRNPDLVIQNIGKIQLKELLIYHLK